MTSAKKKSAGRILYCFAKFCHGTSIVGLTTSSHLLKIEVIRFRVILILFVLVLDTIKFVLINCRKSFSSLMKSKTILSSRIFFAFFLTFKNSSELWSEGVILVQSISFSSTWSKMTQR